MTVTQRIVQMTVIVPTTVNHTTVLMIIQTIKTKMMTIIIYLQDKIILLINQDLNQHLPDKIIPLIKDKTKTNIIQMTVTPNMVVQMIIQTIKTKTMTILYLPDKIILLINQDLNQHLPDKIIPLIKDKTIIQDLNQHRLDKIILLIKDKTIIQMIKANPMEVLTITHILDHKPIQIV